MARVGAVTVANAPETARRQSEFARAGERATSIRRNAELRTHASPWGRHFETGVVAAVPALVCRGYVAGNDDTTRLVLGHSGGSQLVGAERMCTSGAVNGD